jgi:endonuclease-3 related protein
MARVSGDRKASLLAVHDRLLEHFGPLHWWPGESPFEVLVGAVLTQNTAWSRVVPAIENLRREGLLGARALRAVEQRRLEELIRPAGTHRVKAAYLRSVLDWLVERYGGSVERALEGETRAKREELLAIRGVGRETADCFLLYAGGHPVFVVDAYTRRVLSRHGLIEADRAYDDLRIELEARLPREAAVLNEMHAQIVTVGKHFCRPRSPRCSACPLSPLFGETGGSPPADSR